MISLCPYMGIVCRLARVVMEDAMAGAVMPGASNTLNKQIIIITD